MAGDKKIWCVSAYACIAGAKEVQKLAPLIGEIIEDETKVLLTKLPIG